MKRKPAYRDGLDAWTEGESYTTEHGEIVEVLYRKETGGDKLYFVELPGVPACAHGTTVEQAISDARAKQLESTPLTEKEKKEYSKEDYRFSVSLFKRITGACTTGVDAWLEERSLDSDVTMTLEEFRASGGGQWADTLEEKLR